MTNLKDEPLWKYTTISKLDRIVEKLKREIIASDVTHFYDAEVAITIKFLRTDKSTQPAILYRTL